MLLQCFYPYYTHFPSSSKAGYYITHTKASVPLLSPPKTVDVIYISSPFRHSPMYATTVPHFRPCNMARRAQNPNQSPPPPFMAIFSATTSCAFPKKHIHPPLNKKDLTHIGGSALQCNTRITMINNVIKRRDTYDRSSTL